MNKAILCGRLTRDPDVREKVTRYTLAVDRPVKKDQQDQETTDFISCVCFGYAAEFASKYLHKGSKILIEGRIQTGSYVNNDGQKVFTTDVVIEHQEFAESKSTDKRNSESQVNAKTGFMNIPDGIEEELPFA